MLTRRFPALLLAPLALLSACGGGGSDNPADGPLAGPCVHEHRDPVFTITTAASPAGAPIPALRLESITLNGQPMALGLLDASARNAVVSAGGIDCTVACGFAVTEGLYAFVASAPGYQATPVQVAARYATFQGGCPSFNSGGTAVVVTLQPA